MNLRDFQSFLRLGEDASLNKSSPEVHLRFYALSLLSGILAFPLTGRESALYLGGLVAFLLMFSAEMFGSRRGLKETPEYRGVNLFEWIKALVWVFVIAPVYVFGVLISSLDIPGIDRNASDLLTSLGLTYVGGPTLILVIVVFSRRVFRPKTEACAAGSKPPDA